MTFFVTFAQLNYIFVLLNMGTSGEFYLIITSSHLLLFGGQMTNI
jgi:hypothetical protein